MHVCDDLRIRTLAVVLSHAIRIATGFWVDTFRLNLHALVASAESLPQPDTAHGVKVTVHPRA